MVMRVLQKVMVRDINEWFIQVIYTRSLAFTICLQAQEYWWKLPLATKNLLFAYAE